MIEGSCYNIHIYYLVSMSFLQLLDNFKDVQGYVYTLIIRQIIRQTFCLQEVEKKPHLDLKVKIGHLHKYTLFASWQGKNKDLISQRKNIPFLLKDISIEKYELMFKSSEHSYNKVLVLPKLDTLDYTHGSLYRA